MQISLQRFGDKSHENEIVIRVTSCKIGFVHCSYCKDNHQKLKEEELTIHFVCRALLLNAKIPTFVQGERRGQVYLDYAEPPAKVHIYMTVCAKRPVNDWGGL